MMEGNYFDVEFEYADHSNLVALQILGIVTIASLIASSLFCE